MTPHSTRVEVVEKLEAADLLRRSTSSSRAQALGRCPLAGHAVGCGSPRRTSGARSPQVIEDRCSVIPEADLLAVGFSEFSDSLQRGSPRTMPGCCPS